MSGRTLAAPGGGDGFVVDPVEVLLPTTLSGTDVAALLLGAVAAGSLVALLAAWLAGWTPRRRRALLIVTAATSAGQLALLLLPFLTEGLLVALTARQPATLLARLLLLVVLTLLPPTTTRPPASSTTLALVLLATVPLAAPGLGSLRDLLIGAALALALLAAGTAVLRARAARRAGSHLVVVAVATTVAAAVVVAGLPEPAPPYHAERLTSGGLALDITVAPVEPGRNEFHLYAWDEQAAEVDLIRAEVLLDTPGGSERFELARISPNHHLSYVLELPGTAPWDYTVEVLPAQGDPVAVTSTIEAVP